MRASGVLMHISSLPSNYGIGTLGKSAYDFVDFLRNAKQTYWQILPLCPTSYGDSPYQSFSTFAGNPYFIDLDLLISNGLLDKKEVENINWGDSKKKVDYGLIYKNRFFILRKAADKFLESPTKEFFNFINHNCDWLDDYSLFMALKDYNNGKSWLEWDDKYKKRHETVISKFKIIHSNEIMFYKVLQFFFYSQWEKLKKYANNEGIKIIGDLPIYVAMDSVDVWSNPELFLLDNDYNPIKVAGCPPDGFSEDGQLWGNPLYDWDLMKKDNYTWWLKRIKNISKINDITRIDHFRGFDSFYSIDASAKTAKKGEWVKGPGIEFFNNAKSKLGKLNIIAEDLGFLTDSVKTLLKETSFPGMKILQFAFDSREDSDYLPHNYINNCVVYTGTHDNNTIFGWISSASKEDVNFAIEYMRLTEEEGYNWGMMKIAWSSVTDTVIVTMQDLLGLGSEARMNTPSTLGTNWQWRVDGEEINNNLAEKISKYMNIYRRNPKEK